MIIKSLFFSRLSKRITVSASEPLLTTLPKLLLSMVKTIWS